MKSHEIQQEQEKLKDAYRAFHGEPPNFSVTDKKLDSFIMASKDSSFSRSQKLMALVHDCRRQLGWKNVCLIFENILLNESTEDQQGTFAVWSIVGEELLRSKNLSLEERISVADDCLKMLDRAFHNFPNDDFAFWLAKFNYNHPNSEAYKLFYTQQSLQWLETASDMLLSKDAEIPSYIYQYQGLCYELLEQWDKALKAYASIDTAQLENENLDFSLPELNKRIVFCKRKLLK